MIGNKVRGPQDEEFLRKHLAGYEFLGCIPYDEALIEADLEGRSPFDAASEAKSRVAEMIENM